MVQVKWEWCRMIEISLGLGLDRTLRATPGGGRQWVVEVD